MIQVARDQEWGDHEVTFREGDAMALPFDADSFDFVFTRFLLVHLPDPLVALREMFRVAKPGALVAAGDLDSAEYESLLADFRRVEADPGRVLIGNPIISVWGQASATNA